MLRRLSGGSAATLVAEKRLKRPRDPIQLGKLIVDIATGQILDAEKTDKDPIASELGRLGGLKGAEGASGKADAATAI
jgi:hypothetical protein